jgi:acyl-coenzyme A synthetase/AMP-(fatty) acid ligase
MTNALEGVLEPAALARHGARVALAGEETVSFDELAVRVRRAAAALIAIGGGPGERVLIAMRDTPEFAAAWLGTVHAGMVAVALNNRLTEAECRHVVADSGARLVLAEAGSALARVAPSRLAAFRRAIVDAQEVDATSVADDAPAFMLYSSGTTGHPKGIVHSRRSFRSLGGAFRAFGIDETDRVFCTSRLFFAYGLDHGLLAPLAIGATAVLHADWPDADAVLEVVARHRPTVLFSVPTMYRRLLAEPRERLAPLRGVRRFIAGGERLSPQLLEHWREAAGGELLNLYGMSETFCACVVTPPGDSNGIRTGRPLPGVDVRLDEAGVLWVRHPAQAQGYANLPAETQAQFRDGWFCTRDVFARDAAGFLAHQGRADELVKVAGQWVQPGELEGIAMQVPGVTEAACVPVAEPDGPERLALFVTTQGDPAAAEREVTALCESVLPRFKRPRWIRAVAELPRTATGKVQRYKLREILAQELARKR